MTWFIVALISPFVHALANHLDKYLLSKWVKDSSAVVLVVFSSLFAAVVLPILFLIDPRLLSETPIFNNFILTLNGVLLAGAVLFYLYALESHEASFVVPLFQLVPVFGLLLGYLILGETLSNIQFWALFLIVLGSFILSFEFNDGKSTFKIKMVLLMLASSFLYSFNSVVFKLFASDEGFVRSLFWNMVGMVMFGVMVIVINSKYRRQFVFLLKTHHYKIISLNILNEMLSLIGEIGFLFAVLLAPVAIVQSIGGLQPLFVFVIGIVITLLFPKFGKESLLYRHIAQKTISIVVILFGLYLLELR